jgi:glycosyltransferase involved in cell wall biosynthesis
MVEAFRDLGDVDFACFTATADPAEAPAPEGIRMIRPSVDVVPRLDRVGRWARGDQPRPLYRYDMTRANAQASSQLADHYDLVYLSHITSWALHGSLATGPTIVDLDNLENLITRAARTQRPATRQWRVVAKWLAQQPVEWIDERRMERVQLHCAAAVDTVTLCSELDAERSGMTNAVVVANGYDRLGPPPVERSGSTLLFVGNLGYPPNADAVRWFANDVLPLVRAEVPDAVFRAVGGGSGALADVGRLDGVTLTGRVEDVQAELDGAAVAVVPIRFGSGTRLKVIEALANRLPMVSTTLGSEGIGVVDGVHALLADHAKAQAAACVRLLGDRALAANLADAGEALWADRYQWKRLQAELVALGRRVAAGD